MMTISVDIHARTSPDDFKPRVAVLNAGKEKVFNLEVGGLLAASIFLSHEQMIELRDVLTQAIADSPLKCSAPACEEQATRTCDICDGRACEEHCSKGGDVEGGTNPNGSPYGAYAVPSQCWRHEVAF